MTGVQEGLPSAASAGRMRILVVSPCRDEAAYMRETLDTMVAQSRRPDLWVIVDDGSTDASPAILAEYAARHPWIRVVTRADRGRRAVGPGVVDAFYAGLESVELGDFDIVSKLDLDLRLPPRYLEILEARMAADPRLGSCSGKPYMPGPGGRLISEKCGDEMSVGMTKFYRVSCFREIGGLVREVMWDAIDCHTARMRGWKVRSWDEPELRFVHLRPMGSSQHGVLTGRMRHGFGQYFMGSTFLYFSATAAFRMLHPPFVIGGLAIWWGYVRAWLDRTPRYGSPEFRRYLAAYQWRCLLTGKRGATDAFEKRLADHWSGGAAP